MIGDFNARVRHTAIPGMVGISGEQHKYSNEESLIMIASSNANDYLLIYFLGRRSIIGIRGEVEEIGV